MQTFLPYANFKDSAACLDNKRLGKQRVEVLQILKALHTTGNGWAHHPAVLMWRGYSVALATYGLEICREWKNRGFADTCEDKIREIARIHLPVGELPSWLGNEDFHASHRSNLLRKNPEHYSKFLWKEGPDLPYVWPK